MFKENTIPYKESYYNFKLMLDNGKHIIYNSKTGAIAILYHSHKDPLSYLLNKKSIQSITIKNNLIKQGFIIKNDKNEFDEIKSWHENFMNVKNLIQLILLPSEACNFSCPYCFIYRQRNIFMEKWVYDALYKYIIKRISLNTVLQLSWFGGEPLLAHDNIIAFMKRVKHFVSGHENVIINSSLYTNGYLLTSELFEQLYNCGIRIFQVTIDGNRETHDTLRNLKSGEPTFDIIYKQLKDISTNAGQDKEFIFYIRTNFLKSTLPSMGSLLNSFCNDFKDDHRFRIYFRPVSYFETTRNDIKKIAPEICTLKEGITGRINMAFKVLHTMPGNLKDKAINIFQPLPRPIYTWCTGRNRNAHIIGADGSVFSCDTLVVDKDKSVGKLTSQGEIVLNKNAEFWNRSIFKEKNEDVKKCFTCKILPVCHGGCKLSNAVSGRRECFLSENDILDSMKKYACLISN